MSNVTKVSQFKAQFIGLEGTIAQTSTYVFRQRMLAYGVQELGFTVASAASAYNALVAEAIKEGRLEKVKRGVLQVPESEVTFVADENVDDMKWALVNKETRKIEGYVPSKNKGYATKSTAQTVVKVSELG